MEEQSHATDRIRFGTFEADLESRELFKEGQRIPLANQSFVALAALLERPGQLVSREELRRRLWPDNRVVDFDQGLNAIINRLREALGGAAGGIGLIETLPRRGYRFTGAVQRQQVGEPATQRDEGVRLGRRTAYGLAIVLCLLAASAVMLISRARPDGSPKVEPLTSLIGREVAPAFTPDGERLLFAWNGDAASGGHFDLYSKHVGSERLLCGSHTTPLRPCMPHGLPAARSSRSPGRPIVTVEYISHLSMERSVC